MYTKYRLDKVQVKDYFFNTLSILEINPEILISTFSPDLAPSDRSLFANVRPAIINALFLSFCSIELLSTPIVSIRALVVYIIGRK